MLNGSDPSAPLASETAASLERQGFSLRGIANAPATVATTEVEYAEGHADAGQAVADCGSTARTCRPPTPSSKGTR